MVIAPGVDVWGIDPRLYLWLLIVGELHKQATGQPLVVTSCRRPKGRKPSHHSPTGAELVTAADVRRWDLDKQGRTEKFCRLLQAQYGDFLGVLVEPEWLTDKEITERGGRDKVAPHVHLQLKGEGWPR